MKRTALFALPALMAAALALPSTGSAHAATLDVPPRTDKSCGNPVGLPVSETFTPQRTITMYSPAFHSPDTRTLNVDLAGELDDPSGNPALGSVGVQVFQCCDVRDSEIMPQVIGSIGPAGSPAHKSASTSLANKCTIPTKFNNEYVYYLRLRVADSTDAVRLSYSAA